MLKAPGLRKLACGEAETLSLRAVLRPGWAVDGRGRRHRGGRPRVRGPAAGLCGRLAPAHQQVCDAAVHVLLRNSLPGPVQGMDGVIVLLVGEHPVMVLWCCVIIAVRKPLAAYRRHATRILNLAKF